MDNTGAGALYIYAVEHGPQAQASDRREAVQRLNQLFQQPMLVIRNLPVVKVLDRDRVQARVHSDQLEKWCKVQSRCATPRHGSACELEDIVQVDQVGDACFEEGKEECVVVAG